MSFYDDASLVVIPSAQKTSKLYAVKPTDGSGDLAFTRTGDTATRVNSAGLIVPVLANVPRLDYLGSTCPRLLLEPQRTNLVTYSEQFNNAAWLNGQNSGAATITANQIISPDGYLDADKIAFPSVGAGGQYNVFFQPFTASAAAYSGSVYLRGENGGEVVWISFTKDGVNYNRTQCTLTTAWQRFTLSATLTAGSDNFQIGVDTRDSSQSARPAQTIYAWGAQLEAGAYATSYIPTLAASATRGADTATKTGISSLIGQTEGTIFVEEYYDASIANNGGLDDVLVALTDGTTNNLFLILHYGVAAAGYSNVVRFFIRNSNTTQAQFDSAALPTGTYKIALAYKNNDVVGYINGVQVGSDTSATIPATSVVTLVDPVTLNEATKTVYNKQVLLFKTRLTNAELAELTTL